MSLLTKRAAAIAVAAMMFFTLANTDGSGAFAQESDQTAEASDLAAAEPGEAEGPRFVANEVVQPLPGQTEQIAREGAIDAPLTLGELVSDMPTEGELSRDMRCLAQAVYFEARGEPLEGQLAVARVVINRAESTAFPDDYCGVVTQRSQFSFVKGGAIPQPRTSSPAWTRAVAVAQIAHQELWDSPVEDSLYFHATYVRPAWARQKQARATLARHVFYR